MSNKTFVCRVLFIALLILFIVNWSTILAFLNQLLVVIFPIIIGAIAAYILNLIMVRIEKVLWPKSENKWLKILNRPLAILLSFVIIILFLVLLTWLVVPQIISAGETLVNAIPTAINRIANQLDELERYIPYLNQAAQIIDINWNEITNNIIQWLNQLVSSLASSSISLITSSISALTTFLLSFMFTLYFLISKENLIVEFFRLTQAFLTHQQQRIIINLLNVTNFTFANYISGMLTESIILGVMMSIVLWIFQVPYAIMLGTLQGALALIPIVGAFFAGAVGVIMVLAVEPSKTILYLILVLIVQQIEGDLIYPRVVGTAVGLPGVWTLIAVTIGGGLFGLPGMIFCVPVLATLYSLIMLNADYRTEKQSLMEEKTAFDSETDSLSIERFEFLRHRLVTQEDLMVTDKDEE